MKAQKSVEIKQTWYECPFARFKTKDRDILIRHIIIHHTISESFFACPYCDFEGIQVLVESHILQEHTKSIKFLKERHLCPICDFETKTRDDLVNHIDVTHQFKQTIS